MYNYATITAPFAGVVTKRYANTGAMIQAGTASQSQAMPMVRLSQNNLLRLMLPVPESAVSHSSRRGIGRVSVVPTLGRTFPGRVARVAEKIQQSTRTMDTEVDVPNPSLTLMPGMYAEVNLRWNERKNVLTLPLDAVEGTGDSARVYAVRAGDDSYRSGFCRHRDGAEAWKFALASQEGELATIGRHAGLKDGDKVQPKITEFAAAKPQGK